MNANNEGLRHLRRAAILAVVAVQIMACGGTTPASDSGLGDDGENTGGTSQGGELGSGGIVSGSGGIVSGGGGIVAGGGGITGNGGGVVIDGGKGGSTSSIPLCGAPGYACCAGNACDGGGCCVAGICMAQGGACVGLGGGICANGSCGVCGGAGQPCCAGGASGACTAADTKCTNGICSKCGELGSACCTAASGGPGICNSANAICSNSLCVACGAAGTTCCPGNTCVGKACCFDGMCVGEGTACGAAAGLCQAGRCSGCGAASQACCNSTCYDGLTCRSNVCAACGGSGQPCCTATVATGQCTTGLACTSTGSDAVCARCGTPGDICCAGGTCANGCCSGGRCLSTCTTPDAGSAPDVPVSTCATGGLPCSAIAHFAGTQVVDGKDDEFCAIPSFELNFTNAAVVNEYNTKGKTYAERVVARVAWDAAGIHAFIRGYDITFLPGTSTQPWNGDGIELMFSSSTAVTGLTSIDTNTLHVIVTPPIAEISKDTSSTGALTPLPAGQYATGSDASGYWIELSLPWPGTAPAAGSQIKFDFQLNAADGPSSDYYDSYVRDAQAIFTQGPVTSSTCGSSTIFPFCDDRTWCTTTLQP